MRAPLYFGVSEAVYRALARRARQTGRPRSQIIGEAVRAYLAAPFPVPYHRLPKGEYYRRVPVFLTDEEYRELKALAERWGTDERTVSWSALIGAALARYLGVEEAEPPMLGGVIPTVPVDDPGNEAARRKRQPRRRPQRRPAADGESVGQPDEHGEDESHD